MRPNTGHGIPAEQGKAMYAPAGTAGAADRRDLNIVDPRTNTCGFDTIATARKRLTTRSCGTPRGWRRNHRLRQRRPQAASQTDGHQDGDLDAGETRHSARKGITLAATNQLTPPAPTRFNVAVQNPRQDRVHTAAATLLPAM